MSYKANDFDKAYRKALVDAQTSSTSLSSTPREVSFGASPSEPSWIDIKPAVDVLGTVLPITSAPALIPAEEIWRRAIIPTAINVASDITAAKNAVALGIGAGGFLLNNYKKNASLGFTESQKQSLADEFFSHLKAYRQRKLQAHLEPIFPHVDGLEDSPDTSFVDRLVSHADLSRYADTFTKPWSFSGAMDSVFRDRPDEYFSSLFPNSDPSVNKYIFAPLSGAFDLYSGFRFSPKLFSLTEKGVASSPSFVTRSPSLAQQAANGERVLFNYPLVGSIKGQPVFNFLSNLNHRSKLFQAAKIAKSMGPAYYQFAHADSIINKTPLWLRVLSNAQNFVESLSNQFIPSRILANRILNPDDLFEQFRLSSLENHAPFTVLDPSGLSVRVFSEEVPYLTRVSNSLRFAAKHPNLASSENALKSFFMGAYGAKVAVRNATNTIGQSINSGANILSPTYISTFVKSLLNRPLSAPLESARDFFKGNVFASQSILPPSSSRLSKIWSFIPRKLLGSTAHVEESARLASVASLLKRGYSLHNAIDAVRSNFVDYFVPSLASRSVGTVFPFQQFLFGNQLNNARLLFSLRFPFALPFYLRDRSQRTHEYFHPDDVRPVSYYDNKYGHRAPISSSYDLNFGAFFPQYNNPLLSPFSSLSSRATLPYSPFVDVTKDIKSPKDEILGSSGFSFHQHSPFGIPPTSNFGLFSARNFARAKRLLSLYAPLNELDDLYSTYRSRALNSMFGDRLRSFPEYLSSWIGLYPHFDKSSYYLKYLPYINAYLTNNPKAPKEFREFKSLLDALNINRSISPSSLRHDKTDLDFGYRASDFFLPNQGYFFDWFRFKHNPLTESETRFLGTFLHDAVFNKYRRLNLAPFYDSFVFGNGGLAHSLISSIPTLPSYPSDPESRKNILGKLVSGGATFKKTVDVNGVKTTKSCFAELYNELPVFYKHKNTDPEPLFAGTSDFVLFVSDSKKTRNKPRYAVVSDLKFGYAGVPPAPNNAQLKVYALSLLQMYPSLDYVKIILHQSHSSAGSKPYYIYRKPQNGFTSGNSSSISTLLSTLGVDKLYEAHKADPKSHWNDRSSVLQKLDTLLYNYPYLLKPLEDQERSDFVKSKRTQAALRELKKKQKR